MRSEYKLIPNLLRKFAFATYYFRPLHPSVTIPQVLKHMLSKLQVSGKFRIIDLAITYRCNLKCIHCSAAVLDSDQIPLTLGDYCEIVRQSKQLDNLSWNITGGEPLLMPWLDELISILQPRRHFISIQTNAMLLTIERAKHFARLGVNCITTSLDSVIEEEHNEFRGDSETFQKTIEGVRNARKAGMGVLIAGIVTHQNLRSKKLEDLIKFSNNLGAVFLFNIATPCGNWRDNQGGLLHGDDRRYLYRLLNKYPFTSTDHEPNRNAIGCPAGMEKIYITPYGDVLPCPFIHLSFGNLRQAPLIEIIQKMRRVPQFGSYPKICVAGEDFEFHKKVMLKANEITVKQHKPPLAEDFYENL